MHTRLSDQPERMTGAAYAIQADVWALGILLIELATGRHPYTGAAADGAAVVVFEVMHRVLFEPAPALDRAAFSGALCDLVALWYAPPTHTHALVGLTRREVGNGLGCGRTACPRRRRSGRCRQRSWYVDAGAAQCSGYAG